MSGSCRSPTHDQCLATLRAVLARVRDADLVSVWRVRGNHQVQWEWIRPGCSIDRVQQVVIDAPLRGASPELSWADLDVLLRLLTEISDLPLLGYRASGDPVGAAVVEVAFAHDVTVDVSSPRLDVRPFVDGIEGAAVQTWWPPPTG